MGSKKLGIDLSNIFIELYSKKLEAGNSQQSLKNQGIHFYPTAIIHVIHVSRDAGWDHGYRAAKS